MPKESRNQEFRLRKIYQVKNYLIEEINRNELRNKKHKNVCTVYSDIEKPPIVISTITSYFSIFSFGSLVDIQIGITSSAIRLKICVKVAGIKVV